MELDETIVAIASSHDSSGLRGIVRVSGPDTVRTISKVFQSDEPTINLGDLRQAAVVRGKMIVKNPFGIIESDVYVWPTQKSYTRQPTVEIHTHGSLPLLHAVVETVCASGARLARPGEFTLRAFLAGRIDLAQAEAVLGVIDAVDQRGLNVALEQLAGGLSQPLDELRETLLNLCADVEAGLDFVEDDIEFVDTETVRVELKSALAVIKKTKQQMASREQTGQLPRVVLRGEPNVGKSSLWNAMCRTDEVSAIVTSQAGTTRDYLRGVVSEFDAPFELIDTAGVEHGNGALDHTLSRSAEYQSSHADLVLLCIDGSRPLTDWESAEVAELHQFNGQKQLDQKRLLVVTKSDLGSEASKELDVPYISVCCSDFASIRKLGARCAEAVQSASAESSAVASTVMRCRDSLDQAGLAISRALELCDLGDGEELVAAELRITLEKLGQIVGAIYTDDILDRVFSRFCIGK